MSYWIWFVLIALGAFFIGVAVSEGFAWLRNNDIVDLTEEGEDD